MCGRFAAFRATEDLAQEYAVQEVEPAAADFAPSWNVAPTQGARIVLDRRIPDGVRRELHVARFGLVPSWAGDLRIGSRLINARRESLETKPAFRDSLRRRRCIVPVDGYFEWLREGGRRQPFYVSPPDDKPLALAGLYAFWRDPSRSDDDPDRWVLSVAIVTEDAHGDLEAIHDRVPAMLTRSAVESWLDPDTEVARALAVLAEAAPPVRFRAVSSRVNSPAVNEPGLLEPV